MTSDTSAGCAADRAMYVGMSLAEISYMTEWSVWLAVASIGTSRFHA